MSRLYLFVVLSYLFFFVQGRKQIHFDEFNHSLQEVLYLDAAGISSKKTHPISNTDDYYRSTVISGNWNDITSWESSPDNMSWTSATLVPTNAAKTITIRSGHTIIVNSPVALDETIVAGILELQTGSVLNINDGSGADIDVLNAGVIEVKNSSANNYATMIVQQVNASINIATNGKISILGNGISVATNLHNFATNTSNVWNDGAVFEWNCSTAVPVINGLTYFPNVNTATVPVFRITSAGGAITGAGDFTLNGLLDIRANVSFGGGGAKTFRDGISGTGATISFPAGIGTLTITSSTAVLSGTLNIVLNKTLHLSNGVTIPAGSTVTIDNLSTSNISKDGGIFNVETNAIFDIGKGISMSNTSGSINISGTFRTGDTNGFSGTNSSLPSAGGVINLNAGCTVELNRNDGTNQTLTSRNDFKNLTFSGSGIKSFSSGFNPAGTVLIKDAAIVDAQNQTFGDATTALTMTGGRLKVAGTSSSKPDMEGVYTLTGGVIEFSNSGTVNNETINGEYGAGIPIQYNVIEVTGNRVGQSNTNITLRPGGAFKVKSGAILEINSIGIVGPGTSDTVLVENGALFKCGNAEGFNGPAVGFNSPAVRDNIQTVILEPGSTVEYSRSNPPLTSGDQVITNTLPYQNLIIAGNGNKTAPPGTLEIKGNFTGAGTAAFIPNSGTVLMNGTSTQTYTAVNPFSFYNFTNGNIVDFNIASDLTIVNGLNLSAGSRINLTAGNIILQSDNSRTAYAGSVPTDAAITYGTGKFVIQRFLPITNSSAGRRWRMLTAPLNANNAPTINAAWQEGQTNANRFAPSNLYPGFGTIITRSTTATNGYDQGSTNNPSIYKYSAGAWAPVAATNTGAITDEPGYMIFVRGDRSLVVSDQYVAGIATTLRVKGEINTGIVSIPLDPLNYKLVGNPYPSAISFNNVTVNGMSPSTTAGITFYLWDPKFSGNYNVGGFVTCTSLGNGSYSVTANGSGYVNGSYNGTIESGAAFMMPASAGNIVFNENCKLTSSSTLGIASRPVSDSIINFFSTYLLSGNGALSKVLDGVVNIGCNDFNNAADDKDAPKLISFQTKEKLSIVRDGKKFSIELRQKFIDNDTVFYDLSKLSKGSYQFVFIKRSIDPFLSAILEDNFIRSKTLLPATDSVDIPFSVTDDSASFSADRFRIIFKSSAKFNFINATRIKNDIEVKWQLNQEYNISHYEVERSNNGFSFYLMDSKQCIGNSDVLTNYSFLDKEPIPGIYYYRIKAITANGITHYSNVVKAMIVSNDNDLYVFPNPAKGNHIQLQMNEKPAGTYTILLINDLGQSLIKKIIHYPGGTATQIISSAKTLQEGTYHLEVTGPDKKTASIKFVVTK